MSPDSKEILHNSVYRREPLHVGGRREAPHPAGVDRTEPLAPLPNRLAGDRHASLREEIFSIAESEAESRVEPDRVADDVGWESISVPQPDNTVSAEVPFRECPSRAGLQIPLEAAGVCRVTEPDRDNDTPRSMLRRMRRPTCVVGGEPASQILRQANVVLLRVLLGLQEIQEDAPAYARNRAGRILNRDLRCPREPKRLQRRRSETHAGGWACFRAARLFYAPPATQLGGETVNALTFNLDQSPGAGQPRRYASMMSSGEAHSGDR